MPKFYCEYCKTSLMHDTFSVRKSHLMGKNHIKNYCDYYEKKAKSTGKWSPSDLPYEVNISQLNFGAPGSSTASNEFPYEFFEGSFLPPPPRISTMSAPQTVYNREADKKNIKKWFTDQNNEIHE